MLTYNRCISASSVAGQSLSSTDPALALSQYILTGYQDLYHIFSDCDETMSGLEVAGIVLAALPLIISALEHYTDGIKGVKRYYRYRTDLQSLIDAVKTQKVIFGDTLEQLLTGIVRNDKMATFMENPAAQSEVDLRLRKRLKGGYDAYFANVREMETALAKMMAKLALGPDGKVSYVQKGTSYQPR
ncbi:hypothetical protein N0V95_001339 [Ascochyta clinopodiicola]|nr:hypothetical protein N0V95_001339 [Ascochyta clinopodiicola]